MSDVEKLMGRLDTVATQLDGFTKSYEAEKKVQAEGLISVKAEIAAQQAQLQGIAEIAKKIESGEHEVKSVERSMGEMIVKAGKQGEVVFRAASEGTAADGGYVVEDQTLYEVRSMQNQYGLVRALFGSSIVPMMSDVTKVPVDTYEETAGNTPVPASVSENVAITESDDAQLDLVTLTASKYGTLNYISQELQDDAFIDFIGSYLTPKILRQASKIEDQIVFTTASTGLLNTTDVNSVVLDGDDIADLFTPEGFAHMMRMEDEVVDDALANAKYILHRSINSGLRGATGTNGQFLYAPAAAGDPATFSGWDIMRGSIMPTKAQSVPSKGMLLFGDIPGGCVVGERLGRSIKTSDQYRFNQDQIAVRMTFRFAFGTNANIGQAICVLKTGA